MKDTFSAPKQQSRQVAIPFPTKPLDAEKRAEVVALLAQLLLRAAQSRRSKTEAVNDAS